MKRVPFLILVTVTITATAVSLNRWSAPIEPAEGSQAVSIQSLRIIAPGIVEGATESIALVPEISGIVTQCYVQTGDWVNANQVLIQLDDRRQRFELSAAQAELARAQARLERLINGARPQEREEARALQQAANARLAQAVTSLNRIEQLERENAIASQTADDARSRVAALKAELAAAQSRLQNIEAPARQDEIRLAEAGIASTQAAVGLAQVALEKTALRSPTAASVLDVNAEQGELLTAGEPTPSVVLSDTRRLHVRVFVEELDAPQLTPGIIARITADGSPGKAFSGRIVSMSPRMSGKRLFTGRPNEIYDTKVREVLVEVEEGEGLLIGLRVDVELTTESKEAGTESLIQNDLGSEATDLLSRHRQPSWPADGQTTR